MGFLSRATPDVARKTGQQVCARGQRGNRSLESVRRVLQSRCAGFGCALSRWISAAKDQAHRARYRDGSRGGSQADTGHADGEVLEEHSAGGVQLAVHHGTLSGPRRLGRRPFLRGRPTEHVAKATGDWAIFHLLAQANKGDAGDNGSYHAEWTSPLGPIAIDFTTTAGVPVLKPGWLGGTGLRAAGDALMCPGLVI